MSQYPERITIYEVGPRDGLQNEKSIVPTAAKVRYIDLLTASGLPAIEATSFVSPRAIPQLADAPDVMAGISRAGNTRYPVLVPNERGMVHYSYASPDRKSVLAERQLARTDITSKTGAQAGLETKRP